MENSSHNEDIVTNMATLIRPQKFSEIVAQPYAQGVGKRIGEGLISGQGYLIVGPRGCGKTTLARIIAKSLNCTNRDASSGDPCGECASCTTYDAGAHRSILEINAAAYRGINDIKEKISGMSSMHQDSYMVYIIDEAHMLTKEAFSALLKPLEESFDNVVFILTTTNPEKIIDTVRSRLVAIPIRSMNEEDQRVLIDRAKEHGRSIGIKEWDELTEDDIMQSIASSGGSGRQAITNAASIVYHGVHASLGEVDIDLIVEKFTEGSAPGVLSQCEKVLSDKTRDPITVVMMIIDALISRIESGDTPPSSAHQVAKLATIIDTIDVSTPSSIVSAKIASCVATPEVLQDKPKKTTNKSKAYKVRKTSNIDKVVDVLLHSRLSEKYIDDDLYDILSDSKNTDIEIDEDGNLMVAVSNPTAEMNKAIQSVIENSYIYKRVSKGCYEPPF